MMSSKPYYSTIVRLLAVFVVWAVQTQLNSKASSWIDANPITVSGVVVAANQATLSCRMPARIVSVNTTENSQVHRGQVIVQLDDSDLRAQLNSARASLVAALALQDKASAGRDAQQVKSDSDVTIAADGRQDAHHKRDSALLARDSIAAEIAADLKTAQQSVEKATLVLNRARKTLADLETLDKVGGVSRNDLESARMQATLAQADLDSAVAGVNRIKQGPEGVPFRVALANADVASAELGVAQADKALSAATGARKKAFAVADSDIQSARASVMQARTGVKSASDAVSAMRLISPIEGVASSVGARVGETAQPGTPLATIVSLKNLRVEALVPARNIAGIRMGSHVLISVETQPGRSFDAVVSEIASVAESDQRSIKVKFRLTGSAALRPGLAAKIEIGSRR